MREEKSAGIVIFRKKDGKYLILHYPHGHWSFAKGHMEKGETERETAKREVLEETGIKDLEFLDFRETIDYFFKRNGKRVYKEVVYFLASTKDVDVEISKEHQGFEWLSFEEAMERLTFDNAKKVLKKAHEEVNQ